VVVYGREAGGALACLTAFHSRELIRAVAALDAGSLLPPPEAEPEHRLAIYWATAKETPQAALLAMTLARFRQMKIPVTQKDLGRTPRDLKPDELAELARWIDMLDRI
jgi:hypothetical protein